MDQSNHLGSSALVEQLNKNQQSMRLASAAKISSLVKWLIIFLVIWTPTQNSLTRAYPILPSQMVWLGELVIMLLIPLRLSYTIKRKGSKEFPFGWTELFLVGFVLVGIISTVLNGVPWLTALMGFRSLLQYMPVYYILVTENITPEYVRRFLIALFLVALLQVPVTLLQMAVGLLQTGMIDDDLIIGTFNFNQANTLSYFSGIVILVLVGVLHYYPGRRRIIYLLGGMLIIPFLAGSSRAMLFFLPIVLFWLERKAIWRLRTKRNAKWFLNLVIACSVLAGGALIYLYGRGFTLARLSPRQLFADAIVINPVGNGGRLLHLAYTAETLRQTPWGLWVGMGPGMYTSSAGYFLKSPGLQAITDYFGRQFYGAAYYNGMEVPGFPGAIFYLRDFNQLNSTLGEWGFLGLGLYALIIFRFLRRGVRANNLSDNWPLFKALGMAVSGTALLSFLGTLVISPWEEKTIAFLLWTLTGLMIGYYQTQIRRLVKK